MKILLIIICRSYYCRSCNCQSCDCQSCVGQVVLGQVAVAQVAVGQVSATLFLIDIDSLKKSESLNLIFALNDRFILNKFNNIYGFCIDFESR